MNWNSEAARLAIDVQEQLYTVLRGAVAWYQPGLAVAFGNDGYEQDERTERQVRWLRETLPHFNAPVVGFGLSDDGFTWVLIVRTPNVEWLNAVVWRAWREANPMEPNPWYRAPVVCPQIDWLSSQAIGS